MEARSNEMTHASFQVSITSMGSKSSISPMMEKVIFVSNFEVSLLLLPKGSNTRWNE